MKATWVTLVKLICLKKKKADSRVIFVLGSLYFVRTCTKLRQLRIVI